MESAKSPVENRRPKWPAVAAGIGLLWGGALTLVFAINLVQLWAVWLLATGILIGKLLAGSRAFAPAAASAALSLVILFTVIARALPVYSLDDWTDANRFEIESFDPGWKIEITEPADVETLKSYGARGHYETEILNGDTYCIRAANANANGSITTLFYLLGNSVGHQSGGHCQSVFVPQKEGFRRFVSSLMAKYGHKEARTW